MKFQSQFTGEQIELFLSEVEKLMALNYDEDLAFDTSEIVVDVSSATSAILGKAIIGKMILGNGGASSQQSNTRLGSAILGQFMLA